MYVFLIRIWLHINDLINLMTYDLGFHKTPSEQLHSLFEVQQRQQGTIKRASQEQLKALSQHASSRRRRGRGFTAPFNLLSRIKPIYNDNFGRFFEATPKDYQQLQEIDAGVTYVEINQVITTALLIILLQVYIIYIEQYQFQCYYHQ